MSLIDTAKDIYELARTGATIELQEKLMRMREEAIDLQEENVSLRKRVSELEDALRLQTNLSFDGAIYWKTLSDTERDGPYCQRCYDVERKAIRLQYSSYTRPDGFYQVVWTCTACRSSYTPKRPH